MMRTMAQHVSAHNIPDLTRFGIESQWFNTAPANRTLLFIYAHPDDETFGNAGTIARYNSEGVAIHYICATRGECGTVDSKFLKNYPDIATLRTAELTCAAQSLGFRSVHYLGYRDSGMLGAADNNHPKAFMQASVEKIVGQIVALARALRPHVVITFGPYGGYGHPDHIMIHRATSVAWNAMNDDKCYPEHASAGLSPWSPTKLYYSTTNTRFLKVGCVLLRLIGRDPRRFGANKDMDLLKMIDQTTPTTTAISTGAYLAGKDRSWRCHRSQLGIMGLLLLLPRPIRRLFDNEELFTRVVPSWNEKEQQEQDLFAEVGTV
jgi:LmbE family N-acetylglucosaminyl deacetylase